MDFGFDGFDLKRERERGKESVVLEVVFLRTRLKLSKGYLKIIAWAVIECFISHSKPERFLEGI